MDESRDRPTDPPRHAAEPKEASPNEEPTEPEKPTEPEERSEPTDKVEGETDSDEPVADEPPKKKSRWLRRTLIGIGVAFCCIILVALAAGALYWDAIARAFILSRASAHGVSLDFTTLEVTRNGLAIDHAKLSGVKVSLTSLPGVEITADELSFDLTDFEPKTAVAINVHAKLAGAPGIAIDVKKTTATVEGYAPKSMLIESVTVSADDLHALVDLSNVTMSKPLSAIETNVNGVSIHVKRIAAALPRELTIDIKSVGRKGDATVLTTVSTKLPIIELPLELASVEIGQNGAKLSIRVPLAPELTLDVEDGGRKIEVAVARVPADILAQKLGWSRPPNFALSASATLALPDGALAQLTGSYQAVLEHYVPPHPRELDGILFGDATKASGTFKLDGEKLSLSNLDVACGELELKGAGTAATTNGGHLDLTLDGSVPCADLAASAVGAHLGLGAALITGELARGRLTGSISVHLGVEIDGKDAANPKVHPSASVHCGLSL